MESKMAPAQPWHIWRHNLDARDPWLSGRHKYGLNRVMDQVHSLAWILCMESWIYCSHCMYCMETWIYRSHGSIVDSLWILDSHTNY